MSNGKGDKWRGGWTPQYAENHNKIFGEKMSENENSQLSRDWKYQYGVFAKIKGRSSWNEEQVKMYMDKNDIPYKEKDTMKELVEALKCHEDSKYR